MKTKIIAYTLTLFISIGLTGCDGGNDNKNEDTQTQNSEDNTSVSNDDTSNANPTESPKNYTKEELLAMSEDAETLYTFEEVDGGVRIIAYNGKSDVAIIPNVIDGKNVIVLGGNSFRFDKNIKAVLLPSELTMIEGEAFLGCEELVAVYASGKLIKTIGEAAFASGNNLRYVELPESVDSIVGFPFMGEEITIITPQGSYAEQYAFDTGILKVENN